MARSSIRRGTTGRHTVWANVTVAIVVGPAFLPAPRRRGHVGPDQRLPGWWPWAEAAGLRTTFFGVAVGQGVRYRPIRIAVP